MITVETRATRIGRKTRQANVLSMSVPSAAIRFLFSEKIDEKIEPRRERGTVAQQKQQ